eukprot:TRINITY_DN3693_c0_g2_i1.p1 TRINITY_DN3693_c0_g2~~TRINITY_DN3693_c0_g2_i1.p1  ORF type:complete len:205 (+),score=37.26 TRINITY_DN3693_c0_g2_i1:3-617(+)
MRPEHCIHDPMMQAIAQLIQDEDAIAEAQLAWASFLNLHTEEVASEYVLDALGTPLDDVNFKIPRALLAMRFMNDVNMMINSIQHPRILQKLVERHRGNDFYVQLVAPQFASFKVRMVGLLERQLGASLTDNARRVWWDMLVYIGNAIQPDLSTDEECSLPTILPGVDDKCTTHAGELEVCAALPLETSQHHQVNAWLASDRVD